MKLSEVSERSGNKLEVKTGTSVTMVARPRRLDRHAEAEWVRYVIGSPEGAPRCIYVAAGSPADGVLNSLPFHDDPQSVARALDRAGIAAPTRESLSGSISLSDGVLTIAAGTSRRSFVVETDVLPSVRSITDRPDGGLDVDVSYSEDDEVLLHVPAELAVEANQALLATRAVAVKRSAPRTLERWEYKVVKNALADRIEEMLNELGRDGWELVSLAGLDGTFTVTGNKLVAVMKRRLA